MLTRLFRPFNTDWFFFSVFLHLPFYTHRKKAKVLSTNSPHMLITKEFWITQTNTKKLHHLCHPNNTSSTKHYLIDEPKPSQKYALRICTFIWNNFTIHPKTHISDFCLSCHFLCCVVLMSNIVVHIVHIVHTKQTHSRRRRLSARSRLILKHKERREPLR